MIRVMDIKIYISLLELTFFFVLLSSRLSVVVRYMIQNLTPYALSERASHVKSVKYVWNSKLAIFYSLKPQTNRHHRKNIADVDVQKMQLPTHLRLFLIFLCSEYEFRNWKIFRKIFFFSSSIISDWNRNLFLIPLKSFSLFVFLESWPMLDIKLSFTVSWITKKRQLIPKASVDV